MHANLVGASGFDLEFDERKLAVRRIDLFLYRVMRNRLAATVTFCRHARAALRVPADSALYRPVILLRPAVDQRHVSLVHLAPAELLCQSPMRFVTLCYHHQPAG